MTYFFSIPTNLKKQKYTCIKFIFLQIHLLIFYIHMFYTGIGIHNSSFCAGIFYCLFILCRYFLLLAYFVQVFSIVCLFCTGIFHCLFIFYRYFLLFVYFVQVFSIVCLFCAGIFHCLFILCRYFLLFVYFCLAIGDLDIKDGSH
jgi:hypothetical protein